MVGELDAEELDQFIQHLVGKDRFSGVVLIAKNGKPIFRKAYGLASKRFNVPNKTDTKFNIGSLNKIFTKIAIAKLVEQGKLAYDDFVGKHLPDFPSDIANNVTISHLLAMTSGMGDYWNERFEASIGKLRTVDDFIRLFIDDPLLFGPGEKRHYSNNGYVVLGKIIEVLSGQGYYDYIRENIYRPAGMGNSNHYELDIPVSNLAIGYTKEGLKCSSQNVSRRNNMFLIGIKGSPAGGGYSTVNDLLKFDKALHNHVLLSPKYTSTILLPANAEQGKEPRVVTLAGGAPGVAAFYVKYFASGHTVIILSNYDPGDAEVVEKKIHNMMENPEHARALWTNSPAQSMLKRRSF